VQRLPLVGSLLAVLLVCLNLAASGIATDQFAGRGLAALTLPPHVPIYPVELRAHLAYGPLPEEALDLCMPRGARAPRPTVLLIHGGGWSTGDRTQFSDTCTSLAARGFVAATIDYRLAPAHPWPAPLVDTQLAARWLRAHATELSLDPTRLCSYGFSAGGHLAVFLGVLPTIWPGDEAGLLANQSPAVSCVVDEAGPTDLAAWYATGYPGQMLRDLFAGATPTSDPALYRAASPLLLVSQHSAPMLLLHGTHDTTVPSAQSEALARALTRAGVPVHYISYDGGHGLGGIPQTRAQSLLEQTLAFLIDQQHL
jgi:acetyl esterase/lipase